MQQIVEPVVVNDNAGMCLRFAQSVFGAPARYRSAWDAWNATELQHRDRNIPALGVPVWFSHYGTYGQPPSYENWGHVVVHFTDGRYLSSPGEGYGHEWFNSIEEVERRFNSSYVGWSEDINGLRVAIADTPTPPAPTPLEEDEMYILSVEGRAWLVGKGYCAKIHDHFTYTQMIPLYGQAYQLDGSDNWNRLTWTLGIPANVRGTLIADENLWACWDAERGFFDGRG